MVHIVFTEDSRQRLSSVFAQGHAGWADDGQDIVCAAVSAILQAARLGLEAHSQVPLKVAQQKGDLRFEVPAGRRDDPGVAAILATAHLSVEQIARQYPDHVTCETRAQT